MLKIPNVYILQSCIRHDKININNCFMVYELRYISDTIDKDSMMRP